MYQSRPKNGFSLVELLITIVIIGALGAVAVPIYKNNVQSAIRSEVVVTMGFVENFLNIYYGEYGHFPMTSGYQKVVGAPWNDIGSGKIRGTYIRGGINTYYKCTDGIHYELRIYKHDYLDEDYWVNEQGEYSWEATE